MHLKHTKRCLSDRAVIAAVGINNAQVRGCLVTVCKDKFNVFVDAAWRTEAATDIKLVDISTQVACRCIKSLISFRVSKLAQQRLALAGVLFHARDSTVVSSSVLLSNEENWRDVHGDVEIGVTLVH